MSFFRQIIFESKPKNKIFSIPIFEINNKIKFICKCPICGKEYIYSNIKAEKIEDIYQAIEDDPKFYNSEFEYNCPQLLIHSELKMYLEWYGKI